MGNSEVETLELVCIPRRKGDTCLAANLFYRAWDECLESQGIDKETWVQSSLRMIESVDRYEIGIKHNGVVVGGVTLTADFDPHVHSCLSVMSQYVLPEYRNKAISMRCMRECIRLAKRLGHNMLAYTHRKCDWVYTTTYKRIL